MNISLTAMRHFVEAAKWENFSQAANHLYTAQPNLSKKIADLERTIGVQLFQRTGKQVRLTEAGRGLYEEWTAALEQIDRSLDRARELEQTQRNTLTMGIMEGISVGEEAPRRLDALREHYPGLQLRLERCGIRPLWQGFQAGRLDMIVTSEVGEGPRPLPPACARHLIGTCRGAIAINVHNPIARHSALTLSMLRNESFIAISQEEAPQGYRAIQEMCRRAGFEPRITRDAASIETLLLYVESGIGISILSENSRLVTDPNVRLIPLEDLQFENVVYWHTDPLRPVVRAVIELID